MRINLYSADLQVIVGVQSSIITGDAEWDKKQHHSLFMSGWWIK